MAECCVQTFLRRQGRVGRK